MATYINLADSSSEGLNIGKDARVMTYLHGLSDFWVYMFDDASKVNMLLEANAITASDIYNKFLQLTSVISLENITTLTNTQLKLILIGDNDRVDGKVETYKIPKDAAIKYAKCLVNRAFLPTTNLENEADYYIDEDLGEISFAQPLSGLGFPLRTLSDNTKQWALWAIDAKVDDQLIYDNYAKLLDINPTTSTQLFKDFVYGMYYLFVQGPNLDTLRRGLNIALGIPLIRSDGETILEVRKYLGTDQFLVITDANSYLVPYGLEPTLAVGDVVNTGDEIAQWIEVKDYINDGEWWINFMLPSQLMPFVPPSIPGGGGVNADTTPDRYMTAGSYADWLMRNYLKTHTFLVNVKTLGFKNIQNFEQLSDVIKQVRPTYTTPIYVWTVPTGSEIIEAIDTIKLTAGVDRCECVTEPIKKFRRDSATPLTRGCPEYIRMSASSSLDDLMGITPELNPTRSDPSLGLMTGQVAPLRDIKTLSMHEFAWAEALRTKAQDQYIKASTVLDTYTNYGYYASANRVLNPGLYEYVAAQVVSATRTTTATYFDSAGVLQTAAVNAPRYNAYNSSLTNLTSGLLVETAATNLVFSSVIDSSWTLHTTTGTPAYGVAPDGTTSTFRTQSATPHRYKAFGAVTALTTYTYSVFVKAAPTDSLRIYVDGNIGPLNTFTSAYATFATPSSAPFTSGQVVGAICRKISTGVYRLELSFVPDSTGFNICNAHIYPNSANSQEWWGAQVEVGSQASSYIPTTTATVTRAADVVTVRDYSGDAERPYRSEYLGMRAVYLYTTTLVDVQEKFAAAGSTIPADYLFYLFKPGIVNEAINVHAINDKDIVSYLPILQGNFNYYFTPGTWGPYLSAMFGADSYKTYKPTPADLVDGDYLAFTRIADNCIGVFWVTSNLTLNTPGYFPHDVDDPLTVSFSAPINRGDAALGHPFYFTRTMSTNTVYVNNPTAPYTQTDTRIDEAGELTTSFTSGAGSVTGNIDRSGKILGLSRTFK